jgi:hypothetical protein
LSKKLRTGLELFAFLAGSFIFVAILRSFGLKEVTAVLSHAGLPSLAVFLFFPLMTFWDVAAWKMVFVPEVSRRLDTFQLFLIRSVGEALNNITPFVDIGGEPLKVHFLVQRQGVSVGQAVSATVIAKTSMLVSEAFFMLTGFFVSYWALVLPARSRIRLSWILLIVSTVFFGFLWLQQQGRFQRLNADIQYFYRTYGRRFWTAVSLNWIGWLAGGVETYLFCRIVGLPISIWEGIMLEALTQLVRMGTFYIPMNLGVQEGSMAFFVQQMGFLPVEGVAISLLKRFRQLAWTAVGFVIWALFQYEERLERREG